MKSDIESLRPLLNPKSIAIIGASSTLTRIGGRPIKNSMDYKYSGRILPVNPKYREIAGLTCYPDITQAPGEIDVAVVIVPHSMVLESVRDCGERGVKSLLVISGGFAEVGEEGKKLQAEMISIAREFNMRLIGPNTVGIFNILSGAFMNFSSGTDVGVVPKGNIGVVSQSGGLCSHLHALAAQKQIGLSYIIGTGNEADVGVADCIAYLAKDPDTDVIACYIEGTKDSEKLIKALELARQNKKPVIALKVGKTESGQKAAFSHTGALVGSDNVYDAIFKQYGVYRVDNMTDLLDVAYACSLGLLPKGKSTAIFSVSGGAGILFADEITEQGLEMPEPAEEIQKKLLQLVPYASVKNPIDMTGNFVNRPDLMKEFMTTVLEQSSYDMVITYIAALGHFKPVVKNFIEVINEIRADYPHIPFILSSLVTPETKKLLHDAGISVFDDPDRVSMIAKAMYEISRNLYMKKEPSVHWENKVRNLSVPSTSILTEAESKQIFKDYCIPITKEKNVMTLEEALEFSNKIGYPVVLKGMSPQIPHKTEADLVHLSVRNDKEVTWLFTLIKENIRKIEGAEFAGVLVQEMLKPSMMEMIVGAKYDPVFGPMIMVGLGGIYAEAFKDVSIRKAPVSMIEAKEMIEELRGSKLLKGLRGKQPADIDELCKVIVGLSRLTVDYSEMIEEVDINPVLVYPRGQGVNAADGLITLKSSYSVQAVEIK
ncbi:acetate--CoA ligase family protein [Bacillus sp. JJ1521]|uniref:acetate--CoA ligase family protein n=1 Tax=Bacillus sp. JJ1521 TaxID=3122957 RepID=UPI002FFFEF53